MNRAADRDAEGFRPKQSISIVIPCYRSEATLPTLVKQIHDEMQREDYEIVLVVDGSPDRTWAIVTGLAEHPRVTGLNLMRNYGQHNAVLAGILASKNDIIVTMDDDLQHLPSEIPTLLKALTPEVDLVYGVPDTEEHGFIRSLSSRVVKSAMAVTLGLEHARKISAFRAFRRRLADPLRDLSDAFVSIDVCLSWSTVRVIAVPVAMSKRDQGSSNYRFSDLSSHALDMVTGYSTRPLRVMSVVGLAMSVVGFVLFGYVIYLFISGATEVAGFTTLASMIALFAGVQLLGLGIMGEYLGRLHFRSMRRPTFVVREQTGEVTGGGFEPPNLS